MNTDNVVKAFAGDRWHTVREIAQAIHYSPQHTRYVLNQLADDGVLERVGTNGQSSLWRIRQPVAIRTCRCGHTGPADEDFYLNYRTGSYYTGCVACRRKRYRDGWTSPIRKRAA